MKKFSDWLDTLSDRAGMGVVLGMIGVIYFLIDGSFIMAFLLLLFLSPFIWSAYRFMTNDRESFRPTPGYETYEEERKVLQVTSDREDADLSQSASDRENDNSSQSSIYTDNIYSQESYPLCESVWHSHSLFQCMMGIFVWQLLIMFLLSGKKEDILQKILWVGTVILMTALICGCIRSTLKYLKLYNHIHGNGQGILIPLAEFETVSKRHGDYIFYQMTAKKKIGDKICVFPAMLKIQYYNRNEFEAYLKREGMLKFVYNRSDPGYNMLMKSKNLGRLDCNGNGGTWREDNYAFIFFVLNILVLIFGTIWMFS